MAHLAYSEHPLRIQFVLPDYILDGAIFENKSVFQRFVSKTFTIKRNKD